MENSIIWHFKVSQNNAVVSPSGGIVERFKKKKNAGRQFAHVFLLNTKTIGISKYIHTLDHDRIYI